MSLGFISCKTQEPKSNTVDETRRSGTENLYLMLRIAEKPNGDAFEILSVEKEIIAKQGNPLPTIQTQGNTHRFKSELLDNNGKIIFTQDQNAQFIYGKNKNEAIVKFIIPLPQDAEKIVVKYLSSDSNWLELYTDSIVE